MRLQNDDENILDHVMDAVEQQQQFESWSSNCLQINAILVF